MDPNPSHTAARNMEGIEVSENPRARNNDGLEVAGNDGAQVVNDNAARRRQSAFARRKSSAVIEETPAAVVEASELSEADRRLAEMGYVQVGCNQLSRRTSHLLTLLRALGVQAGILLAIDLLLRPGCFRPLCECLHDLHLPLRGWRNIVRHLVLVSLRFWLLLHSFVCGRTRLRLPYIRRSILHLQISCSGKLGS